MARPPNDKSAALGFEDKLWLAADVLRGNLDPAEYKHVVLGLIFLKYIADAFEERRGELIVVGGDAEDRAAYAAAGVLWVPPLARWAHLRSPEVRRRLGPALDEAMAALEAENAALAGTLPRVYATPTLDAGKLGELVDLVGTLGLGSREHRAKDTLGRVYEYFLSRFASAEGRGGGEFYTPPGVVRLLVELLEPYEGRVYDPCCGSGGMFVQSVRFIEAHGGDRGRVTVYGQESNLTTWRMARMNLTIRGIGGELGAQSADTLHHDLHPELRADFILANPPFNISNWGGERLTGDPRWAYGAPPVGNANFAWLQHIVHHLAPGGVAGVVLANGSMSGQAGGAGEVRRRMVEADLVDCMVELPPQLFYATQIPVCLWILARDKRASGRRPGELLFIDARRLGRLETRAHRVLDPEDLATIARTYHAWRRGDGYADVAGFCKAASLAEIAAHDHVLTPGRYAGAAEVEADAEGYAEKVERLVAALHAQFAEGARLEAQIREELGRVGVGR